MTARTRRSWFGERGRPARSFRPLAENIPHPGGKPDGEAFSFGGPVGGTPTGATGTVALPISDCRCRQGVALVITLLMLSVITFLAVAFLAVSRRERSAVTASLDVNNARSMSDAALARAQAEIIAQMMAHFYGTNAEFLDYDYMVSRNYISPFFTNKDTDTGNVNYDVLYPGAHFNMGNYTAAWVQNIANLYYDPRPPVFVITNPVLYPTNSDFRFWVDVNRNGKFETNGYIPTVINENGTTNISAYFNGEPEWIGVLRDPFSRHSSSNQFIGRYAYMVLPIGKTLDLNYIHNWAKGNYANLSPLTNNFPPRFGNTESDGFARDQGLGSWELNLAGFLDVLSPWIYQNPTNPVNNRVRNAYNYSPPYNGNANGPNTGYAFDDAEAILSFRYSPPGYTPGALELVLPSLAQVFPRYTTNYSYVNMLTNGIDTYCVTAPTNSDPPWNADFLAINRAIGRNAAPWPGSYSTNMFYDPQDLWDPNKTSANFTNRLYFAGMRTNSFDRYTFQRLLQSIGTGSAPEYGTWVNDSFGNPTLRTKVNINWDNTAQIQKNAVYGPMPTNLVEWTPLGFFTNAAELLLRSQAFYYNNLANNIPFGPYYFGLTNILIYSSSNPSIRYTSQIHRMLQLAANIYEATAESYASNYTTVGANLPPVYFPHVYRPLFYATNNLINRSNVTSVYIIGYTTVTNFGQTTWLNQLQKYPFKLPSDSSIASDPNQGLNDNIVGIPWIVGSVKGLPSFNRVSYQSAVAVTRKVLFVRGGTANAPDTNNPPIYTNQFYAMSISNVFGMDAWNPYQTNWMYPANKYVYLFASNYMTIIVTNNYNYGFSNNYALGLSGQVTNLSLNPYFQKYGWPGTPDNIPPSRDTNGFIPLLQTVTTPLLAGYFSDVSRTFYSFSNLMALADGYNGGFLPPDLKQTGWPVHNWTLSVSNRLVYFMFDSGNHLLDFVNLGPFGTTTNFTWAILQSSGPELGVQLASDMWSTTYANDTLASHMSLGLRNQILTATNSPDFIYGTPTNPAAILHDTESWVANDPLVHYTIDDISPLSPTSEDLRRVEFPPFLLLPLSNDVGTVSRQYDPWKSPFGTLTATDLHMLFKDPLVYGPDDWQFPTNKFPSVGWLGRVHRGTPWQTVYLKADNPDNDQNALVDWAHWANDSTASSYPTNDWALVDLFTTAPNDNAARGLLSVNQTNDSAWAALLSGVIAPVNATNGMPIDPTNVPALTSGGTNGAVAVNTANSVNYWRQLQTNGLFHKMGDILQVPALTTESPFLAVPAKQLSDEVVERIPQQILGLLKVGEPQFVIYAWGEALKPKNLYSPNLPLGNLNICTNYEITGEFLSRTVCHIVHTNGLPKFVIDSYNIEPAN